MIKSLWRITFTVIQSGHARNGEVVTLLDFGDRCDDDPVIAPSQGNATSAAIFQGNTSNFPLGAVVLNLSFTRYREVPSNAAARAIALAEQSAYPWGLSGKITIAIEGGSTIDYARSCLLSMAPDYPKKSDAGALHIAFTAALGKPTVVGSFADPMFLRPALWLQAGASSLYDATTAGSGVALAGSVARWEDLSGNGRHLTQATTAARPTRVAAAIGSREAVRFDGVDDSLFTDSAGISPAGDFTLIVVHRYTTLSSSGGWDMVAGLGLDGTGSTSANGQPLLQRINLTNSLGTHHTGVASTNIAVSAAGTLTSSRISAIARAGSTVRVRSNATVATATQTWTVNASAPTLQIGGRQQAVTAFFTGDVAEVIALDRAISTAEESLVFSYLAARYGITV